MVEQAKARLNILREKKSRADQSLAAAEAVYSTLLQRLRDEHKCESVAAAEQQLAVLREKSATLRPRLQTMLTQLDQQLHAVETPA